MDRKTINKVCNEMANVCKLLAKRKDNTKKQKEDFLKRVKVFRGLAKIKSKRKEKL